MSDDQANLSSPFVSRDDAWRKERQAIWERRGKCSDAELEDASALCLSGGGMRSAAYCLGIVQALARANVLLDFDYLSSVSAGGFISGWLWFVLGRQQASFANQDVGDPNAPAVLRLRRFSEMLATRVGVFTRLRWFWAATYLRNIGLNFLWFGTLILVAALAPVLARTVLAWTGDGPVLSWFLWVVGTVFLAVASSLIHGGGAPKTEDGAKGRSAIMLSWITCLILIWAISTTVFQFHDTARVWVCTAKNAHLVSDNVISLLPTRDDIHPVCRSGTVASRSKSEPQSFPRLVAKQQPRPFHPILLDERAPDPLGIEYFGSDGEYPRLGPFLDRYPIPAFFLAALVGPGALSLGIACCCRRLRSSASGGIRMRLRSLRPWALAAFVATLALWVGLLLISRGGPFYSAYAPTPSRVEKGPNSPSTARITFVEAFEGKFRVRTIDTTSGSSTGTITNTNPRRYGNRTEIYLLSESTLIHDLRHSNGWLLDRSSAFVVLVPLLLVSAFVLHLNLFSLFGWETDGADEQRIWHAAIAGRLLRLAGLWVLVSACAILGPSDLRLVLSHPRPSSAHAVHWHAIGISLLGFAGTALTGIAASIAKRAESNLESSMLDGRSLKHWLVGTLAAAAIVIFLIVGGSVASGLLGHAERALGLVNPREGYPPGLGRACIADAVVLVVLWAVLLFLNRRAGLGKFSLHTVFRVSLSWIFFRPPDPGTTQSQQTTPERTALSELRTVKPGYRLFPIFNMTANFPVDLQRDDRPREMENFAASPLVCGTLSPHDPGAMLVRTRYYAEPLAHATGSGGRRGVALGTIAALSGAAASASFGYHRSESARFFMTLFNSRLGAWMPNPNYARRIWQNARTKGKAIRILRGPVPVISSLLGDFAVWLPDQPGGPEAIYLSDGAHFEPLGLYEVLRRRCKYVLVVDAGADPQGTFAAFGEACRRAEADFGIKIRPFSGRAGTAVPPDLSETVKQAGFLAGEIVYPDKPPGHFIYLRPTLLPGMPPAIAGQPIAGQDRDTIDFPHDTTPDGRFTEGQFESYRALGDWQMSRLTGRVTNDGVGQLFRVALAASRSQRPPLPSRSRRTAPRV